MNACIGHRCMAHYNFCCVSYLIWTKSADSIKFLCGIECLLISFRCELGFYSHGIRHPNVDFDLIVRYSVWFRFSKIRSTHLEREGKKNNRFVRLNQFRRWSWRKYICNYPSLSTSLQWATAFLATPQSRIWYSIASIRHNRTKWYGLGFIKCENCALPVLCGRATDQISEQQFITFHLCLLRYFVRWLGLVIFSCRFLRWERTVISERQNRAQISSFNDFVFFVVFFIIIFALLRKQLKFYE